MVPFLRPGIFALATVAATPVVAQTGACGQPEILTTRLGAPLPAGFPLLRLPLFLQRSEPAYVEFSLAVAQTVTLQTENTEGDPVLTLYDRSGSLVGWDDDSAGDLDSLIELVLEVGTYCAQVRPVGAAPIDSVAFNLVLQGGSTGPASAPPSTSQDSVACGGPGFAGTLAAMVTPSSGPSRQTGHTDADTGESWYGLSLASPTRLQLDASSSEIDTVLEVLGADGGSLHENDDYPDLGTNSRIEATLMPGDYCVKVRGFAGAQGSYTLAVEPLGEADVSGATPSEGDDPAHDGPCSDPDLTSLLAMGVSGAAEPTRLEASIDPRIGAGWFALSLDEGVEVALEAGSPDLDTVLELYDFNGRLLFENDDFAGMGTDSRIDTALEPGDYCVLVRDYAGGEGDFTLALSIADESRAGDPDDLPDPRQADQIEDLGLLTDVVRSYSITSTPALFAGFEMAEAGPVVVEGVSISSAFRVALYDADAGLIEVTDVVPAFDAATLSLDLSAGTYFVALINEEAPGSPLLRQITISRP